MVGWRAIVVLGCASLALGALTPWVTARSEAIDAPAMVAPRDAAPAQGPVIAAAAPEPTLEGAIAIGDAVMLEAQTCLEEHGISVYPKSVDDVDELLHAITASVGNQAAVFVHTGTASGIVDGQISRVIDQLGPARRIVWATIQTPDPAWGSFSFEDRTNASIRNVVSRHDEGRVLDWNAAIVKHPEWTVDGIRMSPEGCREYAAKVVKLSGLPRRA